MTATILIDCTHTAHCQASTGVQRVTRRLFSSLSSLTATQAIVCDPFARRWRVADSDETRMLTPSAEIRPGGKRGAVWDFRSRCRGVAIRTGLMKTPVITHVEAAVLPEVFGDHRANGMVRRLRESVDGPIMAVFHDLIPLQMPDATPAGTILSFRRYLKELATVDIVAAVSSASADALRAHWEREGRSECPRIVVTPLAADLPGNIFPLPEDFPPKILCVGSLEGRKNHVALLDAAESLWRAGVFFELELIGLAHAVTGAAAVRRIRELQMAGRPLIWRGAVSDLELEKAYAECHFTVYPSLLEGFGLPVLESLSRGRPCVCSGMNAMKETAMGGGCELTGEPTVFALSSAIRLLCTNGARLRRLAEEASARISRTWDDYARDILELASQGDHRASRRQIFRG